MTEKPIPLTKTVDEARVEELQRELWKYGAIIHNKTFKVIDGCVLAIAYVNPKMKELARSADKKAENVFVRDIGDLRGKLCLVFKNENPSFEVYGGKKAGRVSDEKVREAFEQIQKAEQFKSLNQEMEILLNATQDKKGWG